MPTATYTIVQIALIDETGDSCYRMRWPARQLAEQHPDWRVINLQAAAAERWEWGLRADLLVLYQTHDLDLLPLIARRRAAGKRTVVGYNDNFYAPPPSSPVSREWRSPLLWQIYEAFMQQADGVLVTGPALHELFANKIKTPLHILENHLPASPPPFEELWRPPQDHFNIGWAGSLGHMPDLLALAPTLREILALDPRIVLHLMGNRAIPEMVNLPPDRLRFTEWSGMDQYLRFWEPVQIGLAPLIDTPYNRCRSDVKALEMSSRGVLPLLSEALPYRAFFQKTASRGIRSFGEFVREVEFYLHHPQRLAEDARRCYDYVCAERLGSRRTERSTLYQSLLPAQPGRDSWPCGAGYHELAGTVQGEGAHARTLAAIQAQLKAKDFTGACEAAAAAAAANPWSADLRLLEVRGLVRSGSPAAHPKLAQARADFPADLRFALLALQHGAKPAAPPQAWLALCAQLRAAPAGYAAAFESEVAPVFSRQLERAPGLEEAGERLLEIYHDSAELQFALAFHYERTGQNMRAQALFSAVAAARRSFEQNRRFLSALDGGFIETWDAALKAR